MTTSDLLIEPQALSNHLDASDVLVFDCTYDLAAHGAGRQAFKEKHILGAQFADLHDDLSAHEPERASGGRHPLPTRSAFVAWLRAAGLSKGTLAVVYDRNRLNFAGRLWWMLRWVGHSNVRVLDGGLQAWEELGLPLAGGDSAPRKPGDFALGNELETLVDAEQVRQRLDNPDHILIDARAPERFRGDVEPLDAVAGHIPGALNRPFIRNLDESGKFKSPAQLRAEYVDMFAGRDAADVVAYCGSGVSATPIVLSMRLAGLPAPALYAGSWSDWSARDDSYPKARVGA